MIAVGYAPIEGDPAVSQQVEFIVTEVLVGKTYRATINEINYDHVVVSGDTVESISNDLQALLDTNPSVSCIVEGNIYCTADVAGTAFTYDALVIDAEENAPPPVIGGGSWSPNNPSTQSNASTQTNSEIPVITLTPTIEKQTELFNPSIDSTLCFTPNNKIIIDQGNNISENFKKAHQLLLNFDLTTIPGTLDYNPQRLLTRAEAAKFLSLFAQNILCRETTKTYSEGFFKDLDQTDTTLQNHIILAYEYEIFNGDVG